MKMRSITLVLSMFASLSAYSNHQGIPHYGECGRTGLIYNFEEDHLTLDLQAMSASYFDNDVHTEVPCQIISGAMHCVVEGYWPKIRVLSDGSATVVYRDTQWTDFHCLLPENIVDEMIADYGH